MLLMMERFPCACLDHGDGSGAAAVAQGWHVVPVGLEEDFRDWYGFALFLPRCPPSPGGGLASPARMRLVVQADAQPGPFSGLSLQDGPSCIPIPSMGSPRQVRAPPWSRVPHSWVRSLPPAVPAYSHPPVCYLSAPQPCGAGSSV